MSRPVLLTLLMCAAIFGPPLYFSQFDQSQRQPLVTSTPPGTIHLASTQPPVNSVFSNASFPTQSSPAVLPGTNNALSPVVVHPGANNQFHSSPTAWPTQSPAFAQPGNPNSQPQYLQAPDGTLVTIPPAQQVGNAPMPNSLMPFQLPTTGGQTTYYQGTAYAPDLEMGPMPFLPISNLGSLFRFDITQESIRRQWPRVSTTPGESGLKGHRVALVTGTNSWDLHGSLTYYFDTNHELQRISFQGWAGDASPLLKYLGESYGFKAQPTHLAGLHVAKRNSWTGKKKMGAIILKNPVVIQAGNPVQQVAMVLELNNPNGNLGLSDLFAAKVAAASRSK